MESLFQPWEAEFALNAKAAKALIESQFPSLTVRHIQYLHEGWDSAAFIVNREYVFRFPKRRDRQQWLDSEIGVLTLLENRQLGLGIPKPVFVGKPSAYYPCGFMGYRILSGTQADGIEWNAVDRNTSARRLGEFLSNLHSIEVSDAEAIGAKHHESTLPELLAEVEAARDIIWPALPSELQATCRPVLEGNCPIPQPNHTRRCLVHGDLVDEHLLLDERGRITGIIDWGDACLSDPVIDFAGLFAWLGPEFVHETLKHYACQFDCAFIAEVQCRGQCLALITYGHSLAGRDSSRADRLPMVRNAFASSIGPIGTDSSLPSSSSIRETRCIKIFVIVVSISALILTMGSRGQPELGGAVICSLTHL
jgi:aminoglycoside phosphotransferase (APT) family kinase protein